MAYWNCCEPSPRKVRFRLDGKVAAGPFWITGAVEIDDVSDDGAYEYVQNNYDGRELIENAILPPDYEVDGNCDLGPCELVLTAIGPVTVDLECSEDA